MNIKVKFETKDGFTIQSIAESNPTKHTTIDDNTETLRPDLYILIPVASFTMENRRFICREVVAAKNSFTPGASIADLIKL